MVWLMAALAAHASNAAVFVIDKGILGTSSVISRPVWYAATSGLAAALAGVFLLVDFVAPSTFIVGWSLAAGVLWVAALWLFFAGLKAGEASRVVPIAGSSVPLFTFVFAAMVLGEQLVLLDIVAVFLLIGGGFLLSMRLAGTRGLPSAAVVAALLSGAAFAAYFTLIDFVYVQYSSFWAGLAYVRLGVGVVALGLFLVLLLVKSGQRRSRRSNNARSQGRAVAVAFVASKTLGTVALVLQHYAISLGSVTLVNALQGSQYLFLLLLAVAVSWWYPKLLQEELHRVALWQKVSGIVAVSIGIVVLMAV